MASPEAAVTASSPVGDSKPSPKAEKKHKPMDIPKIPKLSMSPSKKHLAKTMKDADTASRPDAQKETSSI